MFGHRYYHETTRRYVAVFGTLFNDIVIDRKDNAGAVIQQMKVPISYGPKQKFLAKIEGDASLDRSSAITLPRMSFEITGMAYDGDRKVQQINRKNKSNTNDNSKLYSQFAPTPYNVDFELTIMTKYAEDGTKILEQILPFFQPAWTASMQIVDDMNEIVDVPIILSTVSTEDVYEGDFETRRSLMWTLSFTLKGYYYGPISQKKVIKFSNVNLYGNLTSNTELSTIHIQPGLNANGQPVTSLTGIQATAIASISQGLVTNIEVGNDGSSYLSPIVTIAPPVVTAATANTVTLTNTSVSSVGLITSGGGYYNSSTVVDFSSPTSPAVNAELSITMNNGAIDTVAVANSGLYYIGTETVVVQDPGSDVASYSDENFLFGTRSYLLSSGFANTEFSSGSNTEHGSISFSAFIPETFDVSSSDIATGTATISGDVVDTLSVVSGGSRYISPPTVTISSPDIDVVSAIASSVVTANSVGFISVSESGNYYTTAPEVTIQEPTANVVLENASASVALTNGKVTGATIVDGGELYITAPAIAISAPTANAQAATATVTLTGDAVSSITVDNGGVYYTTVPTVTISDSDTGVDATATAVISNGEVTSITVDTSGDGYTSTPTVTISDPLVYEAANTFSANVSVASQEFYFDGDDREGYISTDPAPSITIKKGDTLNLNINAAGHQFYLVTNPGLVDGDGDGDVEIPEDYIIDNVTNQGANTGTVSWTIPYDYVPAVDLDEGGEVSPRVYYQCAVHAEMNGTILIVDPDKDSGDPENHKAVFNATILNGSVSAISITTPGIGYEESANPTVSIEGPTGSITDFTATATATVTNGVVASIAVTDGGYYYETAPTVTVEESTGSISDFAATATATVDAGLVNSLIITDAGRFYDAAPDVSISAPPHASLFESSGVSVFVDIDKQIGIYDATSGLETTIIGDVSNSWTHISVQTPADSSNTHLTINNTQLGTLTSAIETTPAFIYNTDNGVKLVNSHNTDAYIDELVIRTNVATYDDTIPTAAHVSDANTVLYVDFETLPSTVLGEISLIVANGIVTGATIDNAGAGYPFTPTITVAAPDGTPDTFQAIGTTSISNGEVVSVNINYGGLGYITEPTATIRPPIAITAEASAIVDANQNIEEIALTNLGAGYTSIPNVTVSSPDNLTIPYEQINFDDPWDYIVTIEDP